MTGATRPELVTHGFCLDDSRWVHGMLQARMYPKVIENRQCRFDPGWYALSLSNGAATGVVQEMDFRKRYPNYGGPLAYQRGRVLGLVKVGYSLPQKACKGHRWASPDYAVANIITYVIPFDKEKPGPAVRGNIGIFPLKQQERATREAAKFALGAGNRRKTDAETSCPDQPGAWEGHPLEAGAPQVGKAVQATKATKATKAPVKRPRKPEPTTQVVQQVSAQSEAGPSASAPAKRAKAAVTLTAAEAISPSLRDRSSG